MNAETARRLLTATPVFAGMEPTLLASLAEHATTRTYRRGQFVFQQDDPGGSMYVIESGSVKVGVASSAGAEIIFCTLGPGESFGEISFLDGRPRSASVEAMEATRVLVLARRFVEDILTREPALSLVLLAYLGSTIRRLSEQAADLVFLDLEGRLAKCLARLADSHGSPQDDGIRIDLLLTQSDLARLVGASRPSVNQALASFARRGFVSTTGRSIVVTDLDGLRRRART